MLESYIQDCLKRKDILLMTHMVLGYPDFPSSLELAHLMVQAGVDLMELQIPFSEPIADGPMIVKANQHALHRGATVAQCLDAAAQIAAEVPIPVLFMTYYNILFQFDPQAFAKEAASCGVRGLIVPDAPPEAAPEYLTACRQAGLAPIQFFTPNTGVERMQALAGVGHGFVYCIARKGVTGQETTFSEQLSMYLSRCRAATKLPLACGFGITGRKDIDYLKGKADIAVIGSQVLRVLESQGLQGVSRYLATLH